MVGDIIGVVPWQVVATGLEDGAARAQSFQWAFGVHSAHQYIPLSTSCSLVELVIINN